MTARNKRLSLSFTGLAVYVALAAGSQAAGPVPTMASIIGAYQRVEFLLNLFQLVAKNTTTSVNDAYGDLSQELAYDGMTVESIERMERTHALLRSKADSLQLVLTGTEQSANELFDLLDRVAEETSDRPLRERMQADIGAKRREFDEQIKIAEQVLSKVDISVQHYRNILSAAMVGEGLQRIDEYISDINAVIREAEALDAEIQAAISEGRSIVQSLDIPAGDEAYSDTMM